MSRSLPTTAALVAATALVTPALAGTTAGASAQEPPADAGLLYRSVQTGRDRPASRIEVLRSDGSGRRTLLRSSPGTVLGLFHASANGRTLAFVASTLVPSRDHRPAYRRVALQTVPTTGGTPRTLLAGRFAIQSVALSPDGGTVFYARFRPVARTAIAESDYRRSEIYALSVDGGRPRRLTRDDVDDYGIAIGPDGRVTWTRDTRGPAGSDIWSMAADGTGRRLLDGTAADLAAVDVSTDGRLLATRTTPDSARSQLVGFAPDGASSVPVTPATAGGWPAAAWSPDGRRIVALRAVGPAREGRYGVVRIDAATGRVTRSFAPRRGETVLGVDWAPSPTGGRPRATPLSAPGR